MMRTMLMLLLLLLLLRIGWRGGVEEGDVGERGGGERRRERK
jgi:hypothetical protein